MVNIVTLAREAMLTAEPHAGQSALCAECNTGAHPLNVVWPVPNPARTAPGTCAAGPRR